MTEQQEQAISRIRSRGCSIRGVIELSDEQVERMKYHALHSSNFSQYPCGGMIQVGFESPSTGRDREAYIAPDGSRVGTENTWGH